MAALGNLVAGIAHEVNTPLGNSYTLITLLQENLQDCRQKYSSGSLSTNDFEEFLNENSDILTMTTENLQRAAGLIKSFKNLAVDQSSENIRRFNLQEYSNEIILSLYNVLKNKQHKVELKCDPDISLVTDPGSYAQVLSNLIQNTVIHAFEENQEGHISISILRRENLIYIDVCDDGIGIDPKIMPHIFEPFFTTKRGYGGSGLGLHIVYNIVHQQLGGTISCESTPGLGSCFKVVLPAQKAP